MARCEECGEVLIFDEEIETGICDFCWDFWGDDYYWDDWDYDFW